MKKLLSILKAVTVVLPVVEGVVWGIGKAIKEIREAFSPVEKEGR